MSLILAFLGNFMPGLASAIGDYLIKSKQTQAAREGKQDEQGVALTGSYLQAVTDSNKARVAARTKEGAWGPIGIVTFIVGIAFAVHAAAVVMDSMPLIPGIVWLWDMLPLPWLVTHTPCRCVAALPDKFQEVEIAIFQALFYTAPPAAAAVAVAKVFRR